MWFKSSRSPGGAGCVEVRDLNTSILIRDSKYLRDPNNNPALQPIISVTGDQWQAFVEAAVTRESSDAVEPKISVHENGSATLSASDGTVLEYTPGEWDAFTLGAADGEFDQLTEGWNRAPHQASV